MKKFSFSGLGKVIKKAGSGFIDDKVLKLSASLAYYTIFSLAPLLIVILYLFGFFLGREAIEGSIYSQVEGFIGKDSAVTVQEIIKNASIADKGNLAAVIGVVTLFIGATTVFGEIQDSINTIWGLKTKPGKGLMQLITTRVLSFGVIVTLGFLLLVSLGVTALMEALNEKLIERFPEITVVLFYILNIIITFLVITTIFSVIFKVLPDAKIRTKDVIAGAITTSLLFMVGKFGISFYISKAEIGDTYGATGSLVVLLAWVYYSSMILYFGAEFTKAYALEFGAPIHPSRFAVVTRTVEVDEGKKAVQEVEEKKQD